jgi:hypothetical protein
MKSQQRMNCELQGDEPGLQAYFDFNQGIAGAENPDELFVKNKAAGTQASLRNFALPRQHLQLGEVEQPAGRRTRSVRWNCRSWRSPTATATNTQAALPSISTK